MMFDSHAVIQLDDRMICITKMCLFVLVHLLHTQSQYVTMMGEKVGNDFKLLIVGSTNTKRISAPACVSVLQ